MCGRIYSTLARLQREITFSVNKPDDWFKMQRRTQTRVSKTTATVSGLLIDTTYVSPYSFQIQFNANFGIISVNETKLAEN